MKKLFNKQTEKQALRLMITEPFHPKHFPIGSIHTFVGHQPNRPEQFDKENAISQRLLNSQVEILGYGPNDDGNPMYVAKTVAGIRFVFGYELGQ